MIACGARPVFAVPPCDDSPDPCFTDVTDILDGRRQLLPTDDLVVTGTFKVDSDLFQDTDIWTLPTTNSTVSGQTKFSPYSSVTGSPADAFNADSRVGRMFNIPNDVIVTVAPTGRVGNLQLLAKIKDINNTVTIPDSIVAFSQNSVLHSITLGDITGDGYDDLFVSFAEGFFGGVTVAASAVDVNDPSKGLFWHFSTRDDCPYAAMALGNLSGSAQGQASFVGIITSNGSDKCGLLSGLKPPLLCASLIDQDSFGLDTDSTRCISPTEAQGATDVAVAVGNLDGVAGGEEAVWFVGPSASGSEATVLSVDFEATTGSLTPLVKDSRSFGTGSEISNVVVATGRLDWFGANEQAVLGFNGVPKEFPGLSGGGGGSKY